MIVVPIAVYCQEKPMNIPTELDGLSVYASSMPTIKDFPTIFVMQGTFFCGLRIKDVDLTQCLMA